METTKRNYKSGARGDHVLFKPKKIARIETTKRNYKFGPPLQQDT